MCVSVPVCGLDNSLLLAFLICINFVLKTESRQNNLLWKFKLYSTVISYGFGAVFSNMIIFWKFKSPEIWGCDRNKKKHRKKVICCCNLDVSSKLLLHKGSKLLLLCPVQLQWVSDYLSGSLCFVLWPCVTVNRLLPSRRAVDVNGAGWLSLGFLQPYIETGSETHERGATSECVLLSIVVCCEACSKSSSLALHLKFLKYFSAWFIWQSRKDGHF